ncbi:uncharacterized protein CLUP02_13648 [Colletotrichum lupini]|uniref:Uncharacterized protein n=1 Tax=Colletotrichum lupini TaxID=145971 RepID=A0A9Q8T2R3_9PEZI|nr:uncharacterized protein CLUP02_13648 [Colletotrichum lupini]UQC88126.1 hypothetical protein CLUP02_13648 [Colletotrichum lupini]
MINPIIPMQVRVHSETGLSTPGPKQQDARQKDASTHSKTTSPSLTVGHAEKPQSQQESRQSSSLRSEAEAEGEDDEKKLNYAVFVSGDRLETTYPELSEQMPRHPTPGFRAVASLFFSISRLRLRCGLLYGVRGRPTEQPRTTV